MVTWSTPGIPPTYVERSRPSRGKSTCEKRKERQRKKREEKGVIICCEQCTQTYMFFET